MKARPVEDTLRANATESEPAIGACTIGISIFSRSEQAAIRPVLHVYIVLLFSEQIAGNLDPIRADLILSGKCITSRLPGAGE